ncbi:serine/threonine-protein phosphatase 6 regulatory ankyrin repeat subunit A-like [Lingula anatina]|uniref:Serine/threonine-protein phosphatase 6 regulatory ankyrin repeat subunit A-like n=1 Tax=Lingula anatina TaxID=7574 RepID=A0A1S3H7A8_LINAN|nr:serine/threonine-protein phosphatase 6 regulatory ankyrin repeat subunit A-like [Lingula anatina]|eukprot:XP_013382005.1 serine/threonine-protein phosphatase 6 regulatory ankyrin repeat subunit A-like [Lingula anatina]
MSASTVSSNVVETSGKKTGSSTSSNTDLGYSDTISISSGSTATTVNTRVYNLCQKGDWSVLEQVLRTLEKGSPEAACSDEDTGITPLMVAVKENKLVIVERLIDLGVGLNDRAKDGRTVMHFAASYARDDIMKLLINKKADATIPGGPKEQLPLHMACARSSGALAIVQMLLKVSGKDCRLVEDKDGSIPIFLSSEVGNVAVCKECLTQQTEQQIKFQRRGNGDNLMHVACRRKDVDLAKLFVEYGANFDVQNYEGHTPLHISAWEGDEAMMKYLYQAKANPNITDQMDRSPLHIAAERGNTSVVELLVDKFKANVAARTKDGSTLMHIASECGHPDTALTFLKKGVPLHMPNKAGAVCLHAAAKRGHTAVVRSLLQKGAQVDARTKDNYTALHIAVEACRPLVVQTLLGFGAQVELKGGLAQETPLHIAARTSEGEKCAEMLIKSGANVNSIQENGETAMHIAARYGLIKMVIALLEEGGDPCWQSKLGETPLHVSVRHCHWDVADELLRFVATEKSHIDAVMLVNQQNTEGETCVHYAAEITKNMCHREFEDVDVIKLMLEYNGDTNTQTRMTHETPLHYCSRAGNEDILLEMVRHLGPNRVQLAVNKQAKNGWSPLLVACEQGHLDIVKILMQNHARVDVFDEHGKAALHLAAENGHDEVADVLLWHKAFVNAKSKLGVTPLHLAAQNGCNKLVKLLIETHGATIDALSLAKKTPLHMAAQNGQMEVCSTFLKMKADANATDVHGQTPLHLAAENDHSDVVKLFLKHKPELVTMANTNGMTCAHIAASKGSVGVIKELMRFNKMVVTTARNRTNNSTALHLAAEGGHVEVVQVLLEAGASATDENAEGMTAIHLSAKHGHVHILDALKGHVDFAVTSAKTGLTALHVAAHYGQADFVRETLTSIPATVTSEAPDSETGLKDVTAESGLTPLHLASQSGHEGLVRLLLNSPGVQADAATKVQGSIPLHMAAQNGHTSVVSLLLSKSTSQIHVKDKRGRTGLHLSAAHGHYDMVALLLGQGADINVYDKNGWTPLHFAAKAGYLKVVKLLIESGAAPKYESKEGKVPICYAAAMNHTEVVSYLMKRDHNTQHLMDDKKFVFDLMVCGKTNNNRSIQEFITLSPAPVDTAAKMSKNFALLAIREKERSRDLLHAGAYCEKMATELMAIASGTNGASALLKSVDCRGTPFLDILIENEQKEVVSHPTIQKYLSDVWKGNLKWNTWKVVMVFTLFLIVPPVWVYFSLPLRNRYNKVPLIKFMSYLVSHFYLIILFIMTTVAPIYPIFQSGSLIPHWYEWLLLAWLSGLLVSELTNPGDRAGLGWIKVFVIAVSALGIVVHLLAFAFNEDERYVCLYVRNQFFALALLFCFVLLLDFLSFHHLFGPWAIIIRDLMKDLIRFLVILLAFMLGFTLHLSAIYQPVYPPQVTNSSIGQGNGGGGAKSLTPIDTFELLFFSLFGLIEPDTLPTIAQSPDWTINLVKSVFGAYMLVTLIVLINLLIAMMSDTYQRIQAQSDVEWKFGRAKLIRNMNRTSATPSPLNLFTKLITYCKVAYKHKGKICSAEAQSYIHEEEDLNEDYDARSVDLLQNNQVMLRNMMRRNTQVAPESYLRAPQQRGPQCIDDVIDWQFVVHKYLEVNNLLDEHSDEEEDTSKHFKKDNHLKEINEKVTENGGIK